MQFNRIEFMLSALSAAQFPEPLKPEIAFAGRSNVGKSSLVNTLLGRKALARVSSTPGRTQAINFFNIDAQWLCVDLPGYGYAKVPPAMQASWQALMESYLVDRPSLSAVVHVVDVRREPMDSDLQLLEFLRAHMIPVVLVATKTDKLSRQQVDKQVAKLSKAAHVRPGDIVRFSSLNGDGRLALWHRIWPSVQAGEEVLKARAAASVERSVANEDD